MKSEEEEFFVEVIIKLDESARRLITEEQRLAGNIGDDRVKELRRFWLNELTASETESFKVSLNHEDKKLTWIWLRLKHLYQSRAKADEKLLRNTI